MNQIEISKELMDSWTHGEYSSRIRLLNSNDVHRIEKNQTKKEEVEIVTTKNRQFTSL